MLVLFMLFLTLSSNRMGMTLIENLTLKKTAEDNEMKIQNLAFYDQLTGLPNRFLFEDRLNQVITKHQREKKEFALLFIDLDGFKKVNDQLGHHCGDELLKIISIQFQKILRNEDTCARIGGDEFIVILQNISMQNVITVAEKLRETASTPLELSTGRAVVSASIGIAIYPNHGKTQDKLVINADKAMYTAKEVAKITLLFINRSLSAFSLLPF